MWSWRGFQLTAIAASVSEFGAHVSGVDQSAFPANLSLEILPVPENQTVVFYLSGTLAAGKRGGADGRRWRLRAWIRTTRRSGKR